MTNVIKLFQCIIKLAIIHDISTLTSFSYVLASDEGFVSLYKQAHRKEGTLSYL